MEAQQGAVNSSSLQPESHLEPSASLLPQMSPLCHEPHYDRGSGPASPTQPAHPPPTTSASGVLLKPRSHPITRDVAASSQKQKPTSPPLASHRSPSFQTPISLQVPPLPSSLRPKWQPKSDLGEGQPLPGLSGFLLRSCRLRSERANSHPPRGTLLPTAPQPPLSLPQQPWLALTLCLPPLLA